MAGLFFCLASAEGAGLLFCPAAIQPYTSVYSAFYSIHALNTDNAVKPRTGLYRGFSCDCTRSTAHNTRPTKADIIPPVPRWSTHTHRNAPHRYQIPPKRRTLYRSTQPPYYNKVYKGATALPCYGSMPDGAADRRPCKPGGVSVSTYTGSARRLAIWHRSAVNQGGHPGALHPAGQSSDRERRAARNHWRLLPHLFSGFRPIANRGQQ